MRQRTKKESWRQRCQTLGGDVRVEPWKGSFPGDVLYTKAKKTNPKAYQREIAEREHCRRLGGVAGW